MPSEKNWYMSLSAYKWAVLVAFSKYIHVVDYSNLLIAVFTAGKVHILAPHTETWYCNLKRSYCTGDCVLLSLQTFHKIAV